MSLYVGEGLISGGGGYSRYTFFVSCRYKAVYFWGGEGGAYERLIMWGII